MKLTILTMKLKFDTLYHHSRKTADLSVELLYTIISKQLISLMKIHAKKQTFLSR